MIFVTGGFAQGRLDYVLKEFNLGYSDVFDAEKKHISEFDGEKVIYRAEEIVTQLLAQNKEIQTESNLICEKLKNCIVISQEVGCGIVPADEYERRWRETVGRMNCIFAEKSDAVFKICCGIAVKLKGGGKIVDSV
jgi:hypothetical protein